MMASSIAIASIRQKAEYAQVGTLPVPSGRGRRDEVVRILAAILGADRKAPDVYSILCRSGRANPRMPGLLAGVGLCRCWDRTADRFHNRETNPARAARVSPQPEEVAGPPVARGTRSEGAGAGPAECGGCPGG